MKRVTCTLYSSWCIIICLVIPILSLLLFIQSLYSLFKLQIYLYNERRKKLQEDRIQLLKTKQRALQRSQEKCLREKEHLAQGIVQCGLLQSPDEIVHCFAKEKTKSAKVKALKAQINFRRKVLEQTHSDKDVCFLKESKATFCRRAGFQSSEITPTI